MLICVECGHLQPLPRQRVVAGWQEANRPDRLWIHGWENVILDESLVENYGILQPKGQELHTRGCRLRMVRGLRRFFLHQVFTPSPPISPMTRTRQISGPDTRKDLRSAASSPET